LLWKIYCGSVVVLDRLSAILMRVECRSSAAAAAAIGERATLQSAPESIQKVFQAAQQQLAVGAGALRRRSLRRML
jgi:hypothetical protein